MPLAPGARLGHYTIERSLGAGGMGEVYKARDTRLNRDVAVKSLPDLFADDPERIARFQREAQVLATLNHPHIAGIHGLEELEHGRFLILEFIDGQSLAERLAAGRLAMEEAVGIARQILEALEAAHDKGIIHRDIKPANIMLTVDGQAKVLDFGLARVVESDPAKSAMNSPTLTFAATQVGVVLGTAAYMAPEQAKGRAADKRSDVWAFGCVFYEMLTGQRVFDGEDVSETLAAVLRAEPDWTALPADVPRGIRPLLKRCLERERKSRIPDVSAVRFLLDDALAQPSEPVQQIGKARPAWRRGGPAVVAAVAGGAIAAAAAWYFKPAPEQPVARFEVTPPGDARLRNPLRRLLSISPDGTRIVYNAGGQLFVRALADPEQKAILASENFLNLADPTFSPDGQSIVYFAGGERMLKRISVSGGASIPICPAAATYGISWSDDGVVFGQGAQGIMRVPSGGGKPEVIVALKEGEVAHGPQMLPGGDRVLFTLGTGRDGDGSTLATGQATRRWDNARIVVQSIRSGERTTVLEGGSDARYLPTGHLVYAVGGTLFAVRFDVARLATLGNRVPVVEGVRRSSGLVTGAAHYAVSDTGNLIYVPGPRSALANSLDLGLANEAGDVQMLKLPPAGYQTPRVSPDGKRVAFGTDDGNEAVVYTYELSGASRPQRLTAGGNNRFPVWTPDSKRIAFQSDRAGTPAIWWQPADGTGEPAALTTPAAGEAHIPAAWSPTTAGRLLFSSTKNSQSSLWVYSLEDRKAEPFAGVESTNPIGAVFSPDGQWIAYSITTEGKPTTTYVQPDRPGAARFELFARPGDAPHEVAWSPDGSKLYYNPAPQRFEAVTVTRTPAFAFGNPVVITKEFILGPASAWRNYDVTPDGKFIGVYAVGESGSAVMGQEIQVVLNWFEELKARVR